MTKMPKLMTKEEVQQAIVEQVPHAIATLDYLMDQGRKPTLQFRAAVAILEWAAEKPRSSGGNLERALTVLIQRFGDGEG